MHRPLCLPTAWKLACRVTPHKGSEVCRRAELRCSHMELSPKGPVDYPLERLTPDQFEILTFLLTRAEFPEVVHIRQNDFGLDARRPGVGGKATLRGWQSKHFAGRINWTNCQESVRRAIPFWRPLLITFAFPKVLSGKEQKEFERELVDEFPDLRLDWWDATEIQRRMRADEAGRQAADWLFGNPEADKEALRKALAVGGELSNPGQAAARLAEIQKAVGEGDPHLHYGTSAREADTPAPGLPAGTVASLEIEIDGKRVRFDAGERYPGAAQNAGLGAQLIYSDDEEGRRAREAVDQVIREGGSTLISSGIAAEFGPVPMGFRGLLPEEPIKGAVEIHAVGRPDAEPRGLPVLVRAGGSEIGVVLVPAEPPEGWERMTSGSAGGLEVFLSLRPRSEGGVQLRMDWRWHLGEGTALEQRLAAEVMLAGYRGAPVELVTPHDGKVVVSGALEDVDRSETELAELEQVREFLRLAAEAETWLGSPLYPPARPTEADAKVLSELAARIRRSKSGGTVESIKFTLAKSVADIEQPFQLLVMQNSYGRLFGDTRYLGLERIHVPKAEFDDSVTGEEGPGETVLVVPAEEEKARIFFHSPREAPEKLASEKRRFQG